MSGWLKSDNIIGIKIIKLSKYLCKADILELANTKDNKIIKKGFKISTGWNRGRIPKSIHRFEPLISTPIKGTKRRIINKTIKKNILILKRLFFSINEKKSIMNEPIITNTKCFKKK